MINKITLALLLMLFTFQIQAQCWKTMDGGHMFSIAIKDDGTLWGWGRIVTENWVLEIPLIN